jgi:hypothetical protein
VLAVASWWADQRQEGVAYWVEENRIVRARLVSDMLGNRIGG